MCFTEI